jgi:hypothetical protein
MLGLAATDLGYSLRRRKRSSGTWTRITTWPPGSAKSSSTSPPGFARGRRLERNAEVPQARLLRAGSQSVENPFARAGVEPDNSRKPPPRGRGAPAASLHPKSKYTKPLQVEEPRPPGRHGVAQSGPRRPNGRCVVQGVDVRRSLPPGKKHRREHNRAAPASSE